ncbi:MAG: hypothetical protein ACFFAO_06085 [Candidatus Hermodarchaeota archaeon]
MGISFPWLPDAISFLMIIFFETSLSLNLTIIIGFSLLPFITLCWLIALTDLLFKEKQKIIIILYLITIIILDYYFFLFLLKDPTILGRFIGPFQIRWAFFMMIYLSVFIIIAILTGILFASYSIRSHSPEVKIKGKFILTAFISFSIAATIEAFMHLDPITVVITRTILIFSSIIFYLGFIFPRWLRKIILK